MHIAVPDAVNRQPQSSQDHSHHHHCRRRKHQQKLTKPRPGSAHLQASPQCAVAVLTSPGPRGPLMQYREVPAVTHCPRGSQASLLRHHPPAAPKRRLFGNSRRDPSTRHSIGFHCSDLVTPVGALQTLLIAPVDIIRTEDIAATPWAASQLPHYHLPAPSLVAGRASRPFVFEPWCRASPRPSGRPHAWIPPRGFPALHSTLTVVARPQSQVTTTA